MVKEAHIGVWIASISLVAAALFAGSAGSAIAQQNIGNNVYVCDGAAHAGPCQADDDDGGNTGSRPRGDGYTDNDYEHEDRPPTGWLTTYTAIAIALDGKRVGISIPAGAPFGYQTADAAARGAMADCTKNGGGPCKLVASLPNSCTSVAYGVDDRRYPAFVPLRMPPVGGSALDAKRAGESAAKEAALAECRAKGGTCKGVGYIGCSALEESY